MDDLLIIMHGNKAYANGLKAVLEAFPGHILCFSTWEEKRKKLGNRKPSIWILSEKLAEEADPTGNSQDASRVILLTGIILAAAIRLRKKTESLGG